MGLFSSSNTTTRSTDTTNAAKWQQPYLQDAMGKAQGLFNSKFGSPWFQGPTFAGSDALTKQAVGGIQSYATGAGADAAHAVGVSSLGLLGASGNYLDQISKYTTMAGTDPTQGNVTNAGTYANNPFMDGMIDAASRDVRRNLTESTLPGIDRDAVATGGINSSRAGIAQGIAERGAADQIGDISATMRGAAYQDGLNLSEQGREANLSATGNAAGLFGNAYTTGLAGASQGQQMSYDNLSKLDAAGQINQQDAQGAMDDALKRWTMSDTRDQGLLNNYYGVVGSNSWGKQEVEQKKEKTSPGILNTAIGLGSMVAGFPGMGAGIGSIASSLPAIAPSFVSQGSVGSFPSFNMSPIKVPRLG